MSEVKVPEGYKQTEVGVIPEDWEVVSLGDAVEFLDGQRRPIKYSERTKISGIYPYYGASGIVDHVNDYIFDEELILLGEDGENILSRNLPLAFKVTGKIWVNNHAHVMRPNDNFNITFLTDFLESLDYSLLNSGSAQPKLNKASCLKIKVVKPSKQEQTAIATALSDVDNLIQSLEKLIAKKEAIKTGTMQQLLTGKTRLPKFATREDGSPKGFKQTELGRIPEDWDFIRLPKVAWFQEGPGVRNNQFESYGVKLLNGTNIDKGRLLLDKTERYISEKLAYGQYSHFMIDNLDILIACSGVSIDRFDEKVTIVNDKHLPLCLNTSTMRFKPNNEKLYRFYLFYFLKSSLFKKQIGGTATGSAQLNFGPFHVNKVIIFLPSTKEQTAIATILSDIDTEIQALQQRLEKTKDIKQGMMQQLLTGKVRLAH